MIKKYLLIAALLFTFSVADEAPTFYVDGNGNEIPIESLENPIVRVSSYQRLKRKYKAEIDYSDELKGRIFILEDKLQAKENELIECTKQGPTIIEIVEPDYFLIFVGFMSGLLVGIVL